MSDLWDAIALVLIALVGGVVRVSTPFLFVSLGECLTEKSGRINLGLEGTLVLGAMSGYATSYLTGSPWLGIAAAALTGMVWCVSRRPVPTAACQRRCRRRSHVGRCAVLLKSAF